MANAFKNINVFILCGGLGKRLRRVSGSVPKPMIKVYEQPFLNIIIKYMVNFGFRKFILGTGYKAKAVEEYYSRNQMPGMQILFSREKSLLGTGGAIKNARKLIRSNPFIVLNGDSFCRFNPLSFLKFHKQKKSLISILLRKVSDIKEYGEVRVDNFSRIKNFKEKSYGRIRGGLINAGVYIFDKKAFNLMNFSSKFSLEFDFFPKIVTQGNIYGYKTSSLFIDIGTPARYAKAKKILLNNRIR